MASSVAVKAQDFYHNIGIGYMAVLYNQEYSISGSTGSYSGGAGGPGLVYNPMLAFDMSGSSSFVLAAYPLLGFALSSVEGASALAAELPIAAELFFGDLDDMGGFVGLGFNMGFAADGYYSGGTGGPQISGGGQLYIADQLLKARIGYTLGVIKDSSDSAGFTKDSRSIISLGLLYQLGQ